MPGTGNTQATQGWAADLASAALEEGLAQGLALGRGTDALLRRLAVSTHTRGP